MILVTVVSRRKRTRTSTNAHAHARSRHGADKWTNDCSRTHNYISLPAGRGVFFSSQSIRKCIACEAAISSEKRARACVREQQQKISTTEQEKRQQRENNASRAVDHYVVCARSHMRSHRRAIWICLQLVQIAGGRTPEYIYMHEHGDHGVHGRYNHFNSDASVLL